MQKWYNIHNEISPKEDTAMKRPIRATALLMTLLFMLTGLAALPVAAAEDTVFLGDRKDLFLDRDSLDEFGWNTAHSGEPITIGTQKFDKGLGFHCLPTGMPTASSISPP